MDKMKKEFEIYKNIPIGKIIRYDLLRKGISQVSACALVDISYSHFNALINGHRRIGKLSSYKISLLLDYDKDFLLRIQNYQIEKDRSLDLIKFKTSPPKIRKCVFWDINIQSLDWKKNKNYIINRVLHYGNNEEINAIADFYGLDSIKPQS